MKKAKITYIESGIIYAKLIQFSDWYNISYTISNNGINLNNVLKMELILEAAVVDTNGLEN